MKEDAINGDEMCSRFKLTHNGSWLCLVAENTRPTLNLKLIMESTKPTSNEAENGNKSKPLLAAVFYYWLSVL